MTTIIDLAPHLNRLAWALRRAAIVAVRCGQFRAASAYKARAHELERHAARIAGVVARADDVFEMWAPFDRQHCEEGI